MPISIAGAEKSNGIVASPLNKIRKVGKTKKFIIVVTSIIILCSLSFVCGNVTRAGNTSEGNAAVGTTYNVTYVLNGQTVYYETIEQGKTATQPSANDFTDGIFIIWCVGEEEYDFSLPVTNNLVITASYTKTFYITFTADGVAVSRLEYGVNKEVAVPEVPEKFGYSGEWESYSLSGGNLFVNALYSPVDYCIDFYADDTYVQSVTCSIENYDKLIPAVPFKEGYVGEWSYTLTGEHTVIATAVYNVGLYDVYFYADGEVVYTDKCPVTELNYITVEAPAKEHYTAVWSNAVFDGEAYRVYAEYVPVIYRAQFVADGLIADTVEFTIEDEYIFSPPVPEKNHYCGAWEEYELRYENFTVNAIYSATKYKISFIADDVTVAEVYYTVETCFSDIPIPELPFKEGYIGVWQNFVLNCEDFEVNAIYYPVDNYLEYTLIENNCYAVTGYSGSSNTVSIPSQHLGLPVTEISNSAFVNCSFEEINICEGVQKIGDYAFEKCANLKNIILPRSLTAIGIYAFDGCSSLEEIDLPFGLNCIADGVFKESGIKNITLPDSILSIGKESFYFCPNLVEIVIPDSVISIGSKAFCACYSLESVTFGKNLTYIYDMAFCLCPNFTAAYLYNPQSWSCSEVKAAALISGTPEQAADALVNYSTQTFTCALTDGRVRYE